MKCRNCGDPVDPQRVELGYDYCLNEECQRRCMKRVLVAAVGVNKAGDYYTKAEEVLPPPGPASMRPSPPAEASTGLPEDLAPRQPARRPRVSPKAAPSTLARLRAKEAELDAALEASYQRFCAGEVTAREMDREREALIRAFNQAVRNQNIRYRGMLRRIPSSSSSHR